MSDFPRMVYRGDDVADPANQQIVNDEAGLKAALDGGWRPHPNPSVKAREPEPVPAVKKVTRPPKKWLPKKVQPKIHRKTKEKK